jgi:aspartyl-tRNA(Asn)/glutamyl-tRNA(Gln) amidotransferase subunit C
MDGLGELKKAANLACLELNDEDAGLKADQLKGIVSAFASLKEVASGDLEPLYHLSAELRLREDEAEAPLSVEELVRNAPESEGDLFRIPQLLGGEGS